MLIHIHLQNFAIVESLDLELTDGLTVLTGETGAGKSILLEAMGLALGDRADNSVIRPGCERSDISLTFDTAHIPEAVTWLQEMELDAEDECIIRRTINHSIPSKSYINGQSVPLQIIRELGNILVDLHGQHEHQSLLRREAQRILLDDYAGHNDLLRQLATTYQHWTKLQDDLERLSQTKGNQDARLELLRYQVKELDDLALDTSELDELEQEHKRLSNANRLLETTAKILSLLEDNEQLSVYELLNEACAELQSLQTLDTALNSIGEMLNSAAIQVKEASSELRNYQTRLEPDPKRLDWIESRFADIYALARKHHLKPEELPKLLPTLKSELKDLAQADIHLENLQANIRQLENDYQIQARKLSQGRAKAAKQFSEAVSACMQQLGMDGGNFEISLAPLAKDKYSIYGMEHVEFMVTTNPGQPLKPLTKVASGGELSRISLAIQVIGVQGAGIPTLIFDEVDVGIGGRVAEIVGHQLRELSKHRQVICVTHLPQVAALGNQHLQIRKQADASHTVTHIQNLGPEQRIDEIARMLGGIKITEQTLSHAKEMIDEAS